MQLQNENKLLSVGAPMQLQTENKLLSVREVRKVLPLVETKVLKGMPLLLTMPLVSIGNERRKQGIKDVQCMRHTV